MKVYWKTKGWRRGVTKNQDVRGNCLKKGELGQFTGLRAGLAKKEGGGVFKGEGVDMPVHTMSSCSTWYIQDFQQELACCSS